MSTQIPIASMSLAELTRLAHEVHVGRREPGHTEEVHFERCPHPECVAIRDVLDEKGQR